MSAHDTLLNARIDGSLADLNSLVQIFGLLNDVFEYRVHDWTRQYCEDRGLVLSVEEMEIFSPIIGKSFEKGTGVSLDMEQDHKSLWIESDSSAEIDVVTSALQFWLAHMKSDRVIQIEWSDTEIKRKMLVYGYGGGAAHITRENIDIMTTRAFLEQKMQEMDRRKSTPALKNDSPGPC